MLIIDDFQSKPLKPQAHRNKCTQCDIKTKSGENRK